MILWECSSVKYHTVMEQMNYKYISEQEAVLQMSCSIRNGRLYSCGFPATISNRRSVKWINIATV